MPLKSLSPDLHTRKGRTQTALVVLLAWFAASWPVAAVLDPEEVFHDELPYLVADLAVLVPLTAAALYGLARAMPWADLLVLVVMGAFTYDAVSFLTFAARERLLGLPAVLPAGLIPILLVGMAWLIVDGLRHALNGARAGARRERSETRAGVD
jgi:hypothetical protein